MKHILTILFILILGTAFSQMTNRYKKVSHWTQSHPAPPVKITPTYSADTINKIIWIAVKKDEQRLFVDRQGRIFFYCGDPGWIMKEEDEEWFFPVIIDSIITDSVVLNKIIKAIDK